MADKIFAVRESSVERHLLDECRKMHALCFKFVSPQNAGVPDRIIIYKGHVIFCELKAPGKTPRPLQVEMIDKMRRHGACIFVCDSDASVDEMLGWLRGRRARKEK